VIVPKSRLMGFKGFGRAYAGRFGTTTLFSAAPLGSVVFQNDDAANDTINAPPPVGLGGGGAWHDGGGPWTGIPPSAINQAKALLQQANADPNSSDPLVTVSSQFLTTAQGTVNALDNDEPYGAGGRSAAQDEQYRGDMESLKNQIVKYVAAATPLAALPTGAGSALPQGYYTPGAPPTTQASAAAASAASSPLSGTVGGIPIVYLLGGGAALLLLLVMSKKKKKRAAVAAAPAPAPTPTPSAA
jgi:hypothetical protein